MIPERRCSGEKPGKQIFGKVDPEEREGRGMRICQRHCLKINIRTIYEQVNKINREVP
jgi:hypothetical protein